MAKVDYATLKKGGFMRQKQKNNFSLRLACVGGTLTAEDRRGRREIRRWICTSHFQTGS